MKKEKLMKIQERLVFLLIFLFLLPIGVIAQQKMITGQVVDEQGEAVIGASVMVKGAKTGTITDLDGNFSVQGKAGQTLSISYVGYTPLDVKITKLQNNRFVLKENTEVLDEVVVVGMDTQKRNTITAAVSVVKGDDIVNRPITDLTSALQGNVAGLNFASDAMGGAKGGELGTDIKFNIRGVGSINGGEPYVLVDGIERDLDLVDVEDIASFSILKDASASAVYGVRGANGVILITTKKGAEGKPVINARVEAGFTQPTKMPEFVNSAQWAELYNEMKGYEYYTPEQIGYFQNGTDPDLYPDVDWMHELYKNMASNQRVNLNVSGGGDICKYFVSGSLYNEGSIFRNAGQRYDYDTSLRYNKYSFRANMDFNVTKSTVLNVNLANIYEKFYGPGVEKDKIWSRAFEASPGVYPKEYSDGTLSYPSMQGGEIPDIANNFGIPHSHLSESIRI